MKLDELEALAGACRDEYAPTLANPNPPEHKLAIGALALIARVKEAEALVERERSAALGLVQSARASGFSAAKEAAVKVAEAQEALQEAHHDRAKAARDYHEVSAAGAAAAIAHVIAAALRAIEDRP